MPMKANGYYELSSRSVTSIFLCKIIGFDVSSFQVVFICVLYKETASSISLNNTLVSRNNYAHGKPLLQLDTNEKNHKDLEIKHGLSKHYVQLL